jgi:hypothetical protein
MVHIKHMACLISNKALSGLKNISSEDVTETLSQQQEGSMDAVLSTSRDDSMANTGNNNSESRSGGPNGIAAGITFYFGISNMGKVHIATM